MCEERSGRRSLSSGTTSAVAWLGPVAVWLFVACNGASGGGVDAAVDGGSDSAGDVTPDVVPDPSDGAELDAEDGSELPPPPGSERWILDDDGAVLLLRGINVDNAAKGAADRLSPMTAADADRIASWGFNLVRLLVFWDAIEPSPGSYDQEYLAAVRARIDLLHARGVRVLVDMHQDVYSARFCCDGAPEWAIRDDGLPFVLQPNWFTNYYQPAVQRAFDNFWDADGPHADLQEHYIGAWLAVAAALGDHPAVIGYDLMNEPFPGSLFDIAETLTRQSPADGGTTRTFDEEILGPFYQRLIDAIRVVDRDRWLFFESRYGAPANGSPCYLPRLVDPRDNGPRLVYSPHLYSVTLEATSSYGAEDATIEAWRGERILDAERLGVPLLIGEWGLAYGATDASRFFREVVEMSDELFLGWAYWSYDASGEGGWGLWNQADGANNPAAGIVVRPYPRRIPGTPTTLGVDDAGVMTLGFVYDPGVGGSLEVFVPGTGADAPDVGSTPIGAATAVAWDPVRRLLTVGFSVAGEVEVAVRP